MSDLLIHIGAELKKARKRLRVSQETVARALCISQGNLSKIERGKKGLSIETLVNICELYGITVNEVIPPESKK